MWFPNITNLPPLLSDPFSKKKIPPTPLPLITAGFNKKILAPQRKTRVEAPGHITILQINLYLSTVTFKYSTIGNNVYQP